MGADREGRERVDQEGQEAVLLLPSELEIQLTFQGVMAEGITVDITVDMVAIIQVMGLVQLWERQPSLEQRHSLRAR